MPVAVELTFDPDSTQRIAQLWKEAQKIYGEPKRTELGVRPHISLTVLPDGEPPWLCSVLGLMASEVTPFSLTLASVGAFPGAEGVIYLAPKESSRLRALQRTLDEKLDHFSVVRNPYYLPAVWIPHCTVATDVAPAQRAGVIRLVKQLTALGHVCIPAISIVACQPARELYRLPFLGRQA